MREEKARQERAILSWEDWDAIQVTHTAMRGEKDRTRAERTLEECRKSQRLFVAVTKAEAASSVDVDMVGRFQIECPKRLSKYDRPYGKTTVHKTLSHMSASFNRCNRNSGKKCVRGVVPPERLLEFNPFEQIQWVEPDEKAIRQFSPDELKAFFTYKYLGGCPLVCLFAKASIWGCGRLEEMTELRWDWLDSEGYVTIPDEKAKWGKGKTFRIPPALVAELQGHRNGSPFVWAGYVEQLRAYHRTTGGNSSALKVKSFAPQRLRVSFQKWISAWARGEKLMSGLSHHAFRRTGLQWSREGQLRATEGEYAKAANVGLNVADKHYTTKPQRLWADIAYRNIAGELWQDGQLAELMGLGQKTTPTVSVEAVQAAIGRNDFDEVARLLAQLVK